MNRQIKPKIRNALSMCYWGRTINAVIPSDPFEAAGKFTGHAVPTDLAATDLAFKVRQLIPANFKLKKQ